MFLIHVLSKKMVRAGAGAGRAHISGLRFEKLIFHFSTQKQGMGGKLRGSERAPFRASYERIRLCRELLNAFARMKRNINRGTQECTGRLKMSKMICPKCGAEMITNEKHNVNNCPKCKGVFLPDSIFGVT